MGPSQRSVGCGVDVVRFAEVHNFPETKIKGVLQSSISQMNPYSLGLLVLEVRMNLDLVDMRDGCRV